MQNTTRKTPHMSRTCTAVCRRFTGLAAISLALTLGACSSTTSDRDVRRIPLNEVARPVERAQTNVLIIDARTPGEFGAGHIPGARNLRSPDIDERERDPDLERFRTIIVYGADPGSAPAMSMAKKLMRAGYRDVRLFQEGFRSWEAAGLPVERGGPGVREESFRR
ncbi:MAG: rhodanese-like domain-containing protein [Phycisphaerales bacterium]|nr:MAG: rhodanese-like domain-containing protein [Phycisphaerales bacterium]